MSAHVRCVLTAAGAILAGAAVFLLILAALGIDPDEQPIGVLGWMLGGLCMGPGVGLMVRCIRRQGRVGG